MALPVPDKTWQYNVNQTIADQGTNLASCKRIVRTAKNSLIGFGTLPWTVRYSCNATTAGTAGDGVDRWTTDADLTFAATAHSWIVLRQTGIATNFELCIDLNNATPSLATMVVSFSAGFTGGTTSARPTATDESVVVTGAGYLPNNSASSNTSALHVMQSTDGQCTYLILCSNNVAQAFWMFQKPKNPVTGWTNPSISLVVSTANTNANNLLQATYFNISTTNPIKGRGVSNMDIIMSAEGHGGGLLSSTANGFIVANDLSTEFPIFPIGIFSRTTSNRGRHGQIFDMWTGLEAINNGDTYPNDTTRQFVTFGNFVFPWNGTVPLIA